MSIDFSKAFHEWRKRKKPYDPHLMNNARVLTECVEIEENQEDFDRAIEYLKLWRYFIERKSKKMFDIIDENLIFCPKQGVVPFEFPMVKLSLYVKDKDKKVRASPV
jgi:hypothetical protein